jgi:hypothetical protein
MSDFSFRVSPSAVVSVHEDGIVILDTRNGHLYASNEAGARIWRGVEQQSSVDVIADHLITHYQISRASARQHVISFLAQLERHALVLRERTS